MFVPNSTGRNCYVFWKKLKLHNRGTPNGKKYKGVSNNLITRKVFDVLVENSYDVFWTKLQLQNHGTPNGKSCSCSKNLISRKVCDVLVENNEQHYNSNCLGHGAPNGKKYSFLFWKTITRKVCDVLVENSYDFFEKTITPNPWGT